mmetsp:Transcript_10181/g.36877  ORF Transcript_10181/g.36877 Transcript_10181/m.36877 type:complete len:207 (+) Transcript_10181:571-1191(+)
MGDAQDWRPPRAILARVRARPQAIAARRRERPARRGREARGRHPEVFAGGGDERRPDAGRGAPRGETRGRGDRLRGEDREPQKRDAHGVEQHDVPRRRHPVQRRRVGRPERVHAVSEQGGVEGDGSRAGSVAETGRAAARESVHRRERFGIRTVARRPPVRDRGRTSARQGADAPERGAAVRRRRDGGFGARRVLRVGERKNQDVL